MVSFYLFVRCVGSVISEPHKFFRGDFGRNLNRVWDNRMGRGDGGGWGGGDEIIGAVES